MASHQIQTGLEVTKFHCGRFHIFSRSSKLVPRNIWSFCFPYASSRPLASDLQIYHKNFQ